MRVAFHTLGCKTNSYETQAIREQFERAGFEIAAFTEAADVYVINTCSVTAVAAQKSRQMLNRCKKLSPDSIVAACGCYAQEASEKLKESGIDLVVGNNEKSKILDLVQNRLKEKQKAGEVFVEDLTHCREFEPQEISGAGTHVRAYVKIQDGCNRFCSYCIIPFLRGRSRSRKTEDILKEVRRLKEAGMKEIVLTGIDISDYKDPDTDNVSGEPADALADLIFQIEEMEGIERIRLGSLEAGIITEPFLLRIRDSKKLCPHFHLSLQSGCNETLKRMNRDYTAEEFAESLVKIRNTFSSPAVTTDIIAGFAGETEEEFLKTLAFVKEAGFSQLHVFPYSRRKGTRADLMPGQLTKAEKAKRTRILIREGEELQRKYMEGFLQKKVQILTEEAVQIEGKEYLVGFTPEYVKAAVPSGENKINEIVTVCPEKIISWNQEKLLL